MILLDNQSLINTPHSERFKLLSDLILVRKGWAELVQREVIDFNHPLGPSNLRKVFAKAIVGKREGLVLKPDDPYFDFGDVRRPFSSCCIKLKKEYIGNFGDVGDFAVVGARYDRNKAKGYRIMGLKWTHFYLGCLDNREEVKRWNAKPEFTVVNVVELNETMLRDVVTYMNPLPVPASENTQLKLKLTVGVEQGTPLTVVFTNPLVFDLRCFSFDKVGNTGFWSLRFPMVSKVHFDRDFTDTVSFEQLQEMAKEATTAKELEDSQENLQWIARLEAHGNNDADTVTSKFFPKLKGDLDSDIAYRYQAFPRCSGNPFSGSSRYTRFTGRSNYRASDFICTSRSDSLADRQTRWMQTRSPSNYIAITQTTKVRAVFGPN
ncbi:hypothetical protein QQZ08_003130 [Neonectria magnoliae]|uniref:ATP-dependent DNA ligase family profile domain-containing protein n=1 Tax=Neonectria magnoliae TaxID=2732573 RepID=A0ABR1IC57_9HYPO